MVTKLTTLFAVVGLLLSGFGSVRATYAQPPCTVTVTPQTAYANGTTEFIFELTNDNPGNSMGYILISSPSPSYYTITGASANGWQADTSQPSFVTFTGNSLAPGDSLEIDLTAQLSSYQPGEMDWGIYTSEDASLADGYMCDSNLPSFMADGTPYVTGVNVADVTSNMVTVSWQTAVPADSQIDYGLDTNYGSETNVNPSQVTAHWDEITGLHPETIYHFQVVSNSPYGSSSSGDNTVSTLAAPVVSTPPPASMPAPETPAPNNTPIGIEVTNKSEKTPPSINLTTNIPKVSSTAPTISGVATDKLAIVRLEYSTDGGQNWLPVESALDLGQTSVSFSFTPVNLQDGTYTVEARAINPGGIIATTPGVKVVVNHLPPIVGNYLMSIGPQILNPDSQGVVKTMANVNLSIHLSTVGGATSVVLNTVNATNPNSNISTFILTQSPESGLWSGDLSFTQPGDYLLMAHAANGAGRTTSRELATMVVSTPGKVVSGNKAVSGAKVTVYYLDHDTNNWVVWDGQSFSQVNPQQTNRLGQYQLLLPPGEYYVQVTTKGYQTLNSNIFTLQQTTPLTADLTLRSSSHIGPLHLSMFNFKTQAITPSASQMKLPSEITNESMVGSNLASFSLNDLAGQRHNSTDWLGKPTLICVMSTWSPVTTEQIAVLRKLADNANFNIMPVGLQASIGQLNAYNAIADTHLNWLADPDSSLTSILNAGSSPTNYFVNAQGIIRQIVSGVLTEQQIINNLDSL